MVGIGRDIGEAERAIAVRSGGLPVVGHAIEDADRGFWNSGAGGIRDRPRDGAGIAERLPKTRALQTERKQTEDT